MLLVSFLCKAVSLEMSKGVTVKTLPGITVIGEVSVDIADAHRNHVAEIFFPPLKLC